MAQSPGLVRREFGDAITVAGFVSQKGKIRVYGAQEGVATLFEGKGKLQLPFAAGKYKGICKGVWSATRQ